MDQSYRWSQGGGPASPMPPSSGGTSPFAGPNSQGFNSSPVPFSGRNPLFTTPPGSIGPSPSPNYVTQQPSFYRMNAIPGTHSKAPPEPVVSCRPDSTPSPYDNLSRSPETASSANPFEHTGGPPSSPPTGGPAGPPPPPPPPPPPMPGAMPSWRDKQEASRGTSGADPAQQLSSLPAALQGTMSKDKKPFTYTPGGLDLSEIRSPRIQRRIQANREQEEEEEAAAAAAAALSNGQQQQQRTVQAQVHAPHSGEHSQLPRQIEGSARCSLCCCCLNLAGSKPRGPPPPPELPTGSLPRRYITRQSSGEQTPKNVQSKSFKMLQKVVGTDKDQDNLDNTAPMQSPRIDQDEMRFRGLRHGGEHVPSRSFQALQKMTGHDNGMAYPQIHQQPQQQYPLSPPPQYLQQQQAFLQQRNQSPYSNPNHNQNHRPQQNQYPPQQQQFAQPQFRKQASYDYGSNPQPQLRKQASYDYGSHPQDQQEEEGAVDIRYTGGNIPSRSFRILQEMTGEDPNANRGPSAWSEQAPIRKISRVQVQRDHAPSPPPTKQYPHPEVPASQQQIEAEPRKYSGARIPSHSFRILQAMTGDTNPYRDDEEGTDF